jgi:hypothetical protein
MSSERTQILTLFASGRIDLGETERLLSLVGHRDRFLTLAVGAVLLAVIAWNHAALYQTVDSAQVAIHSALQSRAGWEALQTIQVFFYRFLGELP